MKENDYDFLFDDDELEVEVKLSDKTYKVLIVDDEEDIHTVTKLAMHDFRYKGIPVEFFSAFGEVDTIEMMTTYPDISVILLDVVMENEDSGLRLVDYIRNIMGNEHVRIILRTGQPGLAVEEDVIVHYDINDYKEKAELTRKKLFTAVYSALRSYSDIKKLADTKDGLKKIIQTTGDLFDFHESTFQEFIINLLNNLTLISKGSQSENTRNNGFFIFLNGKQKNVITANGEFSYMVGMKSDEIDDVIVTLGLDKILNSKKDVYADINEKGELIFLHRSYMERVSLYYQVIEDTESDVDLFKLYLMNCVMGIDNYFVKKDIYNSQVESLYVLSDTIEQRSTNTANHVKRVSLLTEIIAKDLGFEDYEVRNVKFASMLHDIGKIGIRDNILLKPGKLTADEFEIMKTHSLIGYRLLNQSNLPIMKQAASIALYHHENWNGQGYPEGLKEESIPIEARIVALIDVFDALVSVRVYKSAWTFEDALAFIKEQSGEKFDPSIVASFMSNEKAVRSVYDEVPLSYAN